MGLIFLASFLKEISKNRSISHYSDETADATYFAVLQDMYRL